VETICIRRFTSAAERDSRAGRSSNEATASSVSTRRSRCSPALASAFQNVSGDIGDPAAWPAKYDIALDPSASASTSLVALRLTEKVKGQIDHALAFVNVPAYTVSRMEWYYVSGGKILMDQRFATVNGVLVPSIQAADIDMPGYKASANAVFEGYDVHVGSTSGTTSTPTSNK